MDEIADKYRSGRSLRDLALTYDADAKTIGRRLKAHGVELRQPGGSGRRTGWQRSQL
jgi:hypothetical protein